ncbi:hypothetical protein TIFTF001_018391 [Ficus carica]|uniref:Uncharacterized protein n=1 Tax=Ficus carica TaxID=3494 RepID=A0AA88DJ77_FICCA|nr:hypothetical protein TIFTF001_018391 [Ficus carica]
MRINRLINEEKRISCPEKPSSLRLLRFQSSSSSSQPDKVQSIFILLARQFQSDPNSNRDGLAGAEAGGAADADNAVGIRSGGILDWLCAGIVPDDDSDIRRRCVAHHACHHPQLALLQSPPSQVVGPLRSRQASQAPAPTVRLFQEENL